MSNRQAGGGGALSQAPAYHIVCLVLLAKARPMTGDAKHGLRLAAGRLARGASQALHASLHVCLAEARALARRAKARPLPAPCFTLVCADYDLQGRHSALHEGSCAIGCKKPEGKQESELRAPAAAASTEGVDGSH